MTSEPQKVSADPARIHTPPSTLEGVAPLSIQQNIPEDSYITSTTLSVTVTHGNLSTTSTAATSLYPAQTTFRMQKLYICPNLQMNEELLSLWSEQILPRLKLELLHHLHNGTWLPEFLMVGKGPDKLKPCILVTCGDDATRKIVEKLYKKLKWLREKLKQTRITFIAVTRKISLCVSNYDAGSWSRVLTDTCKIVVSNDTTTLCGQRILLIALDRSTSACCTFGGVLTVNGRLYGLTTGHPFGDRRLNSDPEEYGTEGPATLLCESLEEGSGSHSPILFDENRSESECSSDSSTLPPEEIEVIPPRAANSLGNLNHEHDFFNSEGTIVYEVKVVLPASSNLHNPRANTVNQDFDWALLDLGILPLIYPNEVSFAGIRQEVATCRSSSEPFPTDPAQREVMVLVADTDPYMGHLIPTQACIKIRYSIFEVQLVTLNAHLRKYNDTKLDLYLY